MEDSDYLAINKASWNKRAEAHVDSDFYDNTNFLAGKSSLKEIELGLLGDVHGLRILHLQCHFGQDTISLSRMGASTLGIDLSDTAIATANSMAKQLDADASFVQCDVYSVPEKIHEKFDVVFTTYGTIGWLPDINRWASVVNQMLKPGGRLIFVEFHPVVWMFDDEFEYVQYRYFKDESIKEVLTGSYADEKDTKYASISWNHGLGEVIGSIMQQGLEINQFKEFDYSPYDCFAGTEKIGDSRYRIKKMSNKIPMCYALEAIKKG